MTPPSPPPTAESRPSVSGAAAHVMTLPWRCRLEVIRVDCSRLGRGDRLEGGGENVTGRPPTESLGPGGVWYADIGVEVGVCGVVRSGGKDDAGGHKRSFFYN